MPNVPHRGVGPYGLEAKVEVRLSPSCRLYEPEAGGSIILKEKNKVCYYMHLLISGFACCKYQLFIIKTERSDSTILGTLGNLGIDQTLGNLGILAHFRHLYLQPLKLSLRTSLSRNNFG